MKIKLNDIYDTLENRERLVNFLSTTIEGRNIGSDFSPYKPNESDDMFWTLDSGNNWKVKFFTENPNIVEIRYRYQCELNKFEEALCGWLVVRIGAEILG